MSEVVKGMIVMVTVVELASITTAFSVIRVIATEVVVVVVVQAESGARMRTVAVTARAAEMMGVCTAMTIETKLAQCRTTLVLLTDIHQIRHRQSAKLPLIVLILLHFILLLVDLSNRVPSLLTCSEGLCMACSTANLTSCRDPRILEGGEMQFRSISKYFFMHSDLNSKIIALRLGEWRIMGVPVKLEDAELYSRNSFQFTFCLVIDTASDETPFRDMAIQFACAFTQLEKRSRFLSTASNEHLLANCLIDMLEQLKHSDIIRICLPDSQEICLTFHNPEARQTIARPLAATTTVDRPKSNRSFTCTTPSNNTTVQARLASLATSSPDHPPSAPDRTSPFCSFRPRRDGPVYVQPWQVPLPLVEFRELLAQTRRYLGLMGGLRWARRRRKPTKNTPGWGEPSKGAKEQIREETGSGSSSDPYPVYLDATLLQVLAFIDGIRTVRAIAVDSEVDESFVVACLEHL
eukprot:GHVS01058224.1.p1 GENE.GHVS01058224.1~~GHVS01058224.1.p1  ORF type:complete len:465 (-),score=33.42 GHVS01058224.1:1075-2469(-)